jgi:hypothetical protein
MPDPVTDPRFAWFTGWANQHLGVTLTFARERSWQEVAACFGAQPELAETMTFLEAGYAEGTHVRVSTVGAWSCAIESLTVIGGDPATLQCLSGGGGEAFALCCTETIDTFYYCSDGRTVFGFDLLFPDRDRRWGGEPDRFAAEMEQAGFFDEGFPNRGMGAKFVELAFGVTLSQEMLEAPLPTLAVG